MVNCIAYSLFGYQDSYPSCFDFRSYMRGLHINIRMAEVLYPDWKVCVMVDEPTAKGKYYNYFQELERAGKIDLHILPNAELCRMMLYRLWPLFELDGDNLKYDRVICRDTDSLLTYKERQAVAYWERGPKMAHAITDSVSHTIPLMGGMIGFMSGPFRERMGVKSFDELLNLSQGISFNNKGSDQEFLNRYVLPKVADSITEHYLLGMPQSFRGDCHHSVQDFEVPGIDLPAEVLKETNAYGFHIGASGFQTDATVKWLDEYGVDHEYYKDAEYWEELEKQYPEVFYWHL